MSRKIGSGPIWFLYKVGKWRHSCIFWIIKHPANCPLGWQKPIWRLGSWLIVTVLSLGFATCWALLISNHENEVIGMLSWGALLILHWVGSGIGARMKDQQMLEEMNIGISSIRKEQKEPGLRDWLDTERSGFEFMLRETRLPNDRLKCTDSNFVVIWNGNGCRALSQFLLHDDVASAPANFKKTIFRQNRANILPGKDAQFTQQRPPTA
jgi:hypothetical protein